MKNFIGGLFQTKDETYEAYKALQEAGFAEQDMKILSLKESKNHSFREGISIKSVAIFALVGVIKVPAFIPLSDPFFTLNAFGLFLAQGAVTGAILGVIIRLSRAREKPVFTSSGVRHGGVVLAVSAEENQREKATEEMQKAGAFDLVNLSKKWDQEVWSGFKELQPPPVVS